MGAGFCSLYREIHYNKIHYMEVWVYIPYVLCYFLLLLARKKKLKLYIEYTNNMVILDVYVWKSNMVLIKTMTCFYQSKKKMRNDVTFAIISEYEKWMNNDFILAVNKKSAQKYCTVWMKNSSIWIYPHLKLHTISTFTYCRHCLKELFYYTHRMVGGLFAQCSLNWNFFGKIVFI